MKRLLILLTFALAVGCGGGGGGAGGAGGSSVRMCQKVYDVYVTNDHAISVRNEFQRDGYNAWIETRGSLYAGTRTYAVWVEVPCQ